MSEKPHVAVVGATGAVGIEMIKTLEKRNFPVGKLTLLASARSVGKKLMFRGEEHIVRELTKLLNTYLRSNAWTGRASCSAVPAR